MSAFLDLGDGLLLPRPGACHIDNLIATMLLQGNKAQRLNLDRIALHQGFDAAEFTARFAELETIFGNQLWVKTQHPVDDFGGEGK